jgi:hypothetical protein
MRCLEDVKKLCAETCAQHLDSGCKSPHASVFASLHVRSLVCDACKAAIAWVCESRGMRRFPPRSHDSGQKSMYTFSSPPSSMAAGGCRCLSGPLAANPWISIMHPGLVPAVMCHAVAQRSGVAPYCWAACGAAPRCIVAALHAS